MKSIDLDKLKDKEFKEVSTEEALKSVEPYKGEGWKMFKNIKKEDFLPTIYAMIMTITLCILSVFLIVGVAWFIQSVEDMFGFDRASIGNYMGAMFMGIGVGTYIGAVSTVKLIMYCKKHKLYNLGKDDSR